MGYVSTGIYFLGKIVEYSFDLPPTEWSDQLVGDMMMIGLVSTSCGVDTFNQYRKTRKFISENKTVIGAPLDKYRDTILYCTRTGIRLAARENGLEYLLKKK